MLKRAVILLTITFFGFGQECKVHYCDICNSLDPEICSECQEGYKLCEARTLNKAICCPVNCLLGSLKERPGSFKVVCGECKSGFYGEKCRNTCVKDCKDNICNQINGHCDACDLGYYGRYCSIACPKQCGNTSCEKMDGSCAGYKQGLFGKFVKLSGCNKSLACSLIFCNIF